MDTEEATKQSVAPDDVIELVQDARLTLLQNPAAVDKVHLELLRDLSKTAMDSKRIVADKETGEGQAALARALMATVNENRNRVRDITPVQPRDEIPCISEDDLPHFELLEGELSTEESGMDYKEMFGDD